MKEKFVNIYRLAVCTGCPFSLEVTGSLMCQKFKNKQFLMNIEDVTLEMCNKLAESSWIHLQGYIVNQLKLSQTKLGMGFLIEPCEDDPGEANVMLVGPSGIVHKCTLSELFPDENFAVLPSMRIFNESGEDITVTALKAFLQKTYEAAPRAATDPFVSLLNDK